MIAVREIPPELTYDIRHIVLRGGLPRESCYWDTDKVPGTFHLGGFLGERQVGVATFQTEPYPGGEPDGPEEYRLRGMAVLPDARGEGVGTLMLKAGEDRARRLGIAALWCDARIGAVEFYKRNGWAVASAQFDIPTAGPHYRMRKVF